MSDNNPESSSSQPREPVVDAEVVIAPASIQHSGQGIPAGQAVPQIVVQQSGTSLMLRVFGSFAWLVFILFVVLVLGQVFAYSEYFNTSGGVTEKYHSGSKSGTNRVALIRIVGMIVGGEGYIRKQIDRVREDEAVKAVVVRVDSPGGTVTGSDYIYHHLNKLREERGIPVVVSMGSVAASGGYYVSMAVGDQEKSIYAEPTTTTGSIGVIIPHYDISGLMERFDVKDDSIATHSRKQMLAMTRPISDDHRELLEGYLDDSFDRFKEVVKSGRPDLSEGSMLDELATGEIFTANQAKKNGLIDEIGFLEEAIERAIEIAALDPENTRVIQYVRPSSMFSLSGIAAARDRPSELELLIELSTPRAHYVLTSLPPLLSSYASGR